LVEEKGNVRPLLILNVRTIPAIPTDFIRRIGMKYMGADNALTAVS